MSALVRFAGTVRQAGFVHAAHKAFDTLVPEPWLRAQSVRVLCRSSDRGCGAPAARTDTMWLRGTEREALARAGYDDGALQRRFDTGGRAAALILDGEMAAVSWFTHGSHWEYPWLEVCLEPRACWNWDIWVRPDRRAQGLGTRLQRWALASLAGAGVDRVFNSVDAWNRPSLGMCTATGFETIGHFSYLRIRDAVWLRAQCTRHRVDTSRGPWLRLHPERLHDDAPSAWREVFAAGC